MGFIARTVPRTWEAPVHMAPYVDVLERAPGAEIRIAVAAPPQHGKTECTIRALIWWLKKFPHLRFVYATYSQHRSDSVSKRARNVANDAGLDLADGTTQREWITPQGGGLLWTSVDGALTGHPIDGVLVIDDPIKDRKEAESETYRQAFKDWYDGVADTRLHPGASVICMMTRWHPDDASGWVTRERDFEYLNLKAIADDQRPANDNREPGEALWEARRPLGGDNGLLAKQRRNPWNFGAMYQGEPRPRGGAVFKLPTRYRPDALPTYGYRVGYGVDLSYTEKTVADWSVCVKMLVAEDGRMFIIDVDRKQVDAPSFTFLLKTRYQQQAAPLWWYASGTEKGSAQFIQKQSIPLTVLDPRGRDKFVRAMDASESWNEGRILVPDISDGVEWRDPSGSVRDMSWVQDFVDEVTAFTGVKDPCDDQVDALVAVHDALNIQDDGLAAGASGGSTRGRRR